MTAASHPPLEPGRAYRTQELRAWSANPTRLAARLVRDGELRRAGHGLFYAPRKTKFGPRPAEDEELLRAFFKGSPFLISGPPRWNALGLGSTAEFASVLVYNTKRTGDFRFDGRAFRLRRVLFPEQPSPEYFAVDLLEHHEMAGVALEELERGLSDTLAARRWNRDRLRAMARDYGTKATQALVDEAIRRSETHGWSSSTTTPSWWPQPGKPPAAQPPTPG